MIRIRRSTEPSVLASQARHWTDEYLRRRSGDTSVPAASETRYRDPEIKAAVIADSHGKCIYCESRPLHVAPGDVEHLLPKSKFPEKIVDWNNLGFVCPDCNRTKGDYFDSREPVVNPFTEEPADYLFFAGAMILERAGSARGIITIRKLGLDRARLVERRTDHLRNIQNLINSWANLPEGSARNEIAAQIRSMADETGEYAAAARAFLALTGPNAGNGVAN